MWRFRTPHMLQSISKLTNFLPNDPFCSNFAPLSWDDINCINTVTKESVCSVFGTTEAKTDVRNAFSTHLYTKPQRSSDFYGACWKEVQICSTVAPHRQDGPQFWLWKYPFSAGMPWNVGNVNSAGCIGVNLLSDACCTAVNGSVFTKSTTDQLYSVW